MNFYIKQKVFSFRDRFFIYDKEGKEKYYVEGEIFSFGKRLHLFEVGGKPIADIIQKVFSFLPTFKIKTAEGASFEVVKHFTFFRHEYEAVPLGWLILGDFFDHSYEISNGERTIVRVSKEWFTFGDAYQISVDDDIDEISALASVLVIDACIEQQESY